MIQDNSATFPPSNTPLTDQRNNLTTPWMAFLRALFNRTGMGTGIPFQVQQVVNPSDANAGWVITADWVFLTTSTPAPVSLPSLTAGQLTLIQNNSGFNLTVNAPTGATIDGGASFTLATGKMQIFWFFDNTTIQSTQLG